ncbi:MAG: glutathione S-transferase [Chloroflexota bacterium]
MIIVHYLNNSRAQRILFLLEEMGLDYETNIFKRVGGLAPEAMKKVHPLGKAPVITDGEHTIAESGAIVEYLAEKYGKESMVVDGDPDDPAVLNYRYWLHYSEGSLAPLLVMRIIFDRIENAKVPFFIKPVSKGIVSQVMKSYLGPNLKNQFDFVEEYLSNNQFFGGERFNSADIMMLFPLEGAMSRPEFAEKYPNIRDYVTRMQARPAYQRALEAGTPYAFAKTSS